MSSDGGPKALDRLDPAARRDLARAAPALRALADAAVEEDRTAERPTDAGPQGGTVRAVPGRRYRP